MAEAGGRQEEKIAPASWEEGEYFELACGVGRSRRYHARMQAFYQSWHDGVAAANAVLGAGAFLALLGSIHPSVPITLTGVIAFINAFETVLKPSTKAEKHGSLQQRFTQLASEIVSAEPTPRNLQKLSAKRLLIDADEPPIRRLADLAAQNEEWGARGIARSIPLTWAQRSFLGCGFTFGMGRLEKWRDAHLAEPNPSHDR